MTIGHIDDDNSTLEGVKIVVWPPYCHPDGLTLPYYMEMLAFLQLQLAIGNGFDLFLAGTF